LDAVSPIEVVVHRVLWSFVFLAIIITVVRSWRKIARILTVRRVVLLTVAACFLAVNWGFYVYAVSSDQVLQASLGYFINPLVSVALGVIILRERLMVSQWISVGLAVVAVGVLTFSYGQVPWISLILAFSFGIYGLVKKFVGIGAVASLTVETAALAPLALIFLLAWNVGGDAQFTQGNWGLVVLLILVGPVTAIPLLAFGAAANRIPLSTLGILQYLTPIMQFLLAITFFQEAMTLGSWIGFVLVWIALILFTIATLRQPRKTESERRSADTAEVLEVSEPT
jgi:chloramphenicol-sensitive protein RarD